MKQPRLRSIEFVAEFLGVSTKTVRRWISQGELTGYRVGERLIRIDLDEVERMIVKIA